MPDGVMIGRGCIALHATTSTASAQTRFLRYEIYVSGIQFYELGSTSASGNQFDIFNEIGGRDFKVDKGHLALVSLPATPDPAFRTLTLSCSPDELTLAISQAAKFADRGSTYFKDLSLQFTSSKSGGSLRVTGQITLVLFDQEILLKPKLVDGGLMFDPEQLPVALPIANLGDLSLTALRVGTNYDKWKELRTLYTFDEGTGDTLFDSAGSRDAAGNPQSGLDLKISDSTVVQWEPNGISAKVGNVSIGAKDKATKLIEACRRNNEIAIEAWIQPSDTVQPKANSQPAGNRGPARIVSLSEDINRGYFALVHGTDQDPADSYMVRLRTDENHTERYGNLKGGLAPFVTPPGSVKAGLSQVLVSRDKDGVAKIYINGVEQATSTVGGQLFSIFTGEVNNQNDPKHPDNVFRLRLANEGSGNRPWEGKYQRIAIYSRALSKEEVSKSYYPVIAITAELTLTNVPAPLNTVFPVSLSLDNGQLTFSQTGLKIVDPDLLLTEVKLAWSKTGTESRLLSGSAKAALWGNPLDFNIRLDANRLEFFLPEGAPDRQLKLKGLGTIALSKLNLSADRTIPNPLWNFETDKTEGKGVTFRTDQSSVAVIPPPLTGPFPIELAIDAGKLWFSISPAPPSKVVVSPLAFDRADLRFRFIDDQKGWEPQSQWQPQKDITIPLFGQSLSLTPTFDNGVFTLTFQKPFTFPSLASIDAFGKLYLTDFSLKAGTGTAFWQLLMAGRVLLRRQADTPELAGKLDFAATGQILDNSAKADPQLPRRLEGTSLLNSLTDAIFAGDLDARGDRIFLNGKFTLFPVWSPLQVDQDAQIEIGPDGRLQLHTSTPAEVGLTDFVLLNPNLILDRGWLALKGVWLGKDVAFTALQRAGQSIWEGRGEFEMPFNLTLGDLYDSQSSVKLTDQIQVSQTQDSRQTLQASLVIALSSAGFLARVNSKLALEDENQTRHDLELAEFQVFTPPANRNAILGPIIQRASQFRLVRGYLITVSDHKPLIYLGDRTSRFDQPLPPTVLPSVFDTNSETTVGEDVFVLQQHANATDCTLTLNPTGKTQDELKTAYLAFLQKLEMANTLRAGAANLIKARIAERLPVTFDRLLFYYYGFDRDKSSVDLLAGMRLRVDFQNYQFVHPSDKTARSGFVGSGTTYYQLNSYPYPADTRVNTLLGFDAFLDLLQPLVKTDVATIGAGGILDLLSTGYRMPYFRLIYPSQVAEAEGQFGAERVAILAGATSLTELQKATDEFQKNGAVTRTDNRISVYFRGRATVIPEISILVHGQPVFVPVGTTLRHVLERYANVPGAMPKQSLSLLGGNASISRLIHDGVQSTPSYRFINLGAAPTAGNGMDIYDIPVVKGDRIFL